MESVFIITTVTGAVELINRLWDRDYRAATKIVVSALIGGAAGLLSIDGVTIATGICLGLSASGIVLIAKKMG